MEGDVSIYFDFKPTESSLQRSADELVGRINKSLGNLSGKKSQGSIYGDEGITTNPSSGQKDMLGVLDAMSGQLTTIAGAGVLVAAFFDAVGPLIKTVLKILGVVLLTLLMPVLKILLPILPGLITALMAMANAIAGPIGDITGAIGETAGKGAEVIGNLAQTGSDFIQTNAKIGADAILGLLGTIMDAIKGFIAGLPESLAGLMEAGGKMLTWITDNLSGIFGKLLEIGTQMGTWFTENILDPLGAMIKAGIDTIANFNFVDIIEYFIAKVTSFFIDGFNSIIGALKQFKFSLPPLSVNLLGKNVQVFGGMNFDPFGGLQNISTPASVASTIQGFEHPNAAQGPVVNQNNTYNITGSSDPNALKKMLQDIGREQIRAMRTKTSYLAGNYS